MDLEVGFLNGLRDKKWLSAVRAYRESWVDCRELFSPRPAQEEILD